MKKPKKTKVVTAEPIKVSEPVEVIPAMDLLRAQEFCNKCGHQRFIWWRVSNCGMMECKGTYKKK